MNLLVGTIVVYLFIIQVHVQAVRPPPPPLPPSTSGGFLSSNNLEGKNIIPSTGARTKDERFLTKEDVNQRIQSRQREQRRDSTRGEVYGEFESSSDEKDTPLSWLNYLPKINPIIDPDLNLKIRQRIDFLGACVTIGFDYLTGMRQYRWHCMIEDSFVGGRFSVRGSELGWAKSFYLNLDALHGLGLGVDHKAKIKLRGGVNLRNWQAYLRVRLRSEPINSFNIAEGLTLFGKVPLMSGLPLRLEYRSRVVIPKLRSSSQKRFFDSVVSLSTGLDRIDVSLDELNLCLEFDKSPVWDIGITKSSPLRRWRGEQERSVVSSSPSQRGRSGGPSSTFPSTNRQQRPAFGFFPSYPPV